MYCLSVKECGAEKQTAEFNDKGALYLIQLKPLVPVKYCTLKEGDAMWKFNIRRTRSDRADSPLIRSQKREDRLALQGKGRSGSGEVKEYQKSPC